MSEFRWYGGIDFSGAREPLSNLWTAVGRSDGGRLLITSLRAHAFRQDLCGWVAGGWRPAVEADDADTVLWGADFPFGLPSRSVPHLGVDGTGRDGWERMLDWVADRPVDEVTAAVPETARGFRATDFGGAMSPFDTRGVKQTVAGMHWLHQLRASSAIRVLPHEGTADGSDALLEVDPTGASRELGLPRRRSPSRPGEIRARAAALRTFAVFDHPDLEALAVTLEDAWDAVVSCVCARLAADDLDQPFRCTDQPREIVEMEGWIYRPPASIG